MKKEHYEKFEYKNEGLGTKSQRNLSEISATFLQNWSLQILSFLRI